ncbi:hypothetical protein BASA50_000341 [Batrachochytrium salamandrivorans]|uniref:Fungal lipase-type domain-containing protein n=1 Tax=Batrachochytrium salamandrivorans TaxID=1357716 RepID=A0ABQ8EU83_9FUNG|nr:hypothetical protein BASA50_000341 [Batrachochytrium salamandrivorans]
MILGTVLASSLAILFVSATPAPIPPSSLFFRDIQRRDVVDSDSTTFSPELVNLSKRAQSVVDANTVSRMSKFMQYSAAVYFSNVSVSGKWECGVVCEGDIKDTVIQTVFLQTSGKITAGIVAIQPSSKTIVVAFRGVNYLSDWITNIQFTKWPAPWLNDGDVSTNHKRVPFPKDLEVHSGFQSAYLDIRSLMMTSIRTAQKKYPGFKLVFTGHSLGGALASLATADYVNHESGDTSNVSVYTYGEPRVGNSQWADWFDSLSITSYRVTSQGDPVPRLPPYMMGYSHTKQEYFITSDKVTKTCTNSGVAGETTDCSTETLFEAEVYAHMYGYYWASGGRNVSDS